MNPLARKVTAVSVNNRGYVTHLWNDGEAWASCPTADAILDIELGAHSYFVQLPQGRAQIVVAEDPGGSYLSTTTDPAGPNQLLALPKRPPRG